MSAWLTENKPRLQAIALIVMAAAPFVLYAGLQNGLAVLAVGGFMAVTAAMALTIALK